MVKLVDTIDLKSIFWGFDSPPGHWFYTVSPSLARLRVGYKFVK